MTAMSPSEEAADLRIPAAADDAWFTCGCSESGTRSGYKPEALYAVVAAELRRIADEIARSLTHLPTTSDADHYFYAGVRDTADGLTRRADELDPPATEEA